MRRRPLLFLVVVLLLLLLLLLLRRYWARASRLVHVLIRVVSGHGSDARVQPACRCHGTAGPGGGNQQLLTDRQRIRADARRVERERRRQRGACAPGRERRWQLRLRQVLLLLGARRCHRLAAAAARARHWQFQAWQHAWSFSRWCCRGKSQLMV